MDKMFEIATRTKMRFPFKGQISVEDMWDLSVENLDSIYKALNSQVKKAQEESLLDVRTKEDEALSVQIEIVKHIVGVKLDEKKAREQAKQRSEKNQKILALIAEKDDEDLRNMSKEELKKLIED